MDEKLKRRGIGGFFSKVSRNIGIIKKSYVKMQKKSEGDAWLSDNYYLYVKAFRDVLSSFSKRKKLPFSGSKNPRIYDVAADYVSLNGKVFTPESAENYLQKISFETELQYDEIELLPDAFRYCYIELAAEALKKGENIDFQTVTESLRALSDYSLCDADDGIYPCDGLLRKNSCFSSLDENSAALYRRIINAEAQKKGITERSYIEKLESESDGRDISFLLFKKKKNFYFIWLSVLFTALWLLCAAVFKNFFVFIFAAVPVFSASRLIVARAYSAFKEGKYVPSVKFSEKTPKNLVTTVSLLSDFEAADTLAEKTERCRISNYDGNFIYGILADLPSGEEFSEKDRELCGYIKRKTEVLNEKYGGGFFAAVRKKTYNPETKKYCGKERKRGAVNDFVRALKENDNSCFLLMEGDFSGAGYITLLDDDTLPEIDSVRRLVGVLEHPVNTPVYNEDKTAVLSGYGAALPRLDTLLSSSLKTHFTSLKSGNSGKELYSNSSFSVWQDLFGESSFAGKGVISIDAFYTVICGLFPENKILSHDIPEGNLLRCVYVSDVCFYDDTPLDIIAFAERENRWIRGDIQNSVFLKHTLVNEKRRVVLNPTPPLGKYRIFLNIAESLYYPSVFFLVLMSAFAGVSPLVLGVILFFFGEITNLFMKLFRPVDLVRLRFRSFRFSAETTAFLDRCFSFICLPFLAYNSLNAVFSAIYRMKSGKNLLSWRAAASLGGGNRKLSEIMKAMFPQYIGIPALFSPVLFLPGVLWLSSFFVSYLLAESPRNVKKPIAKEKRLDELKTMWKYFDTFVNGENSYLPPDNFQEEPTPILARRTSPTNIGLYLVSLLGAYYLNIIDFETFKERLKNTVETLKRMEKFNGHLYNWYSTADLKILKPAFISTVDNGNFICSLVTVYNALEIIGEVGEVAEDIKKIIADTDFSFLYSERKSLFSVGFDCEKNKLVNSFYDIYASEALLTYYYAVSERQIPIKAWEKLNRYRYIRRGYSCIKSWSGTMFEYFMPCLFLPVIKKSFNNEMLCGAFYEQEKRNPKSVWGNSESCFYSFDKALNYQYKAFGVQSLAVKRGVGKNNVVSPYSSWLVLPFFSEKATENLDAFRDINAYGKYGYYDAVDKTPLRTGNENAVIKTYMAHHIGMSFIAGVNYLKNDIIVKNFNDEKRRAFSTLLEEKNVSYDRSFAVYPEFAPQKKRVYRRGEEFTVMNPDYPSAKIISNGDISSCLSDSGNGYLLSENIAVTRRPVCADDPAGIFAFFKSDKTFLPATFSPIYDGSVEYKTFYEHGKMTYCASSGDTESRYSVTAALGAACEIREYRIKNNSQKSKKGKCLFYFEPVLCDYKAFNAHPAFSELFLKGEKDREEKNIYVCKRRREDGKELDWLCVAVFRKTENKTEKIETETEFSKFNVLPRGKGVSGIEESFSRTFSEEKFPVSFCVAARFPAEIGGREEATFILITACGKSKASAREALEKAAAVSFSKHAAVTGAKMRALTEKLSIRKMESKLMDIMYSSVFVKSALSRKNTSYSSSLRENALWKYGLSSEKPMIVIRMSEKNREKADPFLASLVALRTLTPDFSAALCFHETGRYDRPLYNHIIDRLILLDGEKYLNDGIYICNVSSFDELALFASAASFYINLDRNNGYGFKLKKYEKTPVFEVEPVPLKYTLKCGVGGYIENGGEIYFGIDDKKAAEQRALWSMVLANENFGTVVTETTPGFTFALNSGLNKLTPWAKDASSGFDGEKLFMKTGGRVYDITKNASVIFGKGLVSYFCTAADFEIRTDIFVSQQKKEKIVKIAFKNHGGEKISFEYEIKPLLAERENFAPVRILRDKNCLVFTNGFNPDFSGFGYLYTPFGICTKNGVSTLETAENGGEIVFVLGYAEDYASALKRIGKTDAKTADAELSEQKKRRLSENRLIIKTPNEELNMFFSFLEYQTLSSRLFARCGFYQCGGAFGFRDQLQDAACLSRFEPGIFCKRLFAAASRQFYEGDVLHWWHDIKDGDTLRIKGSRTRSSDDLLWLPYAAAVYYENTENTEFLKTSAPYIEGEKLAENESEKYISVFVSSKEDTVYCHAKKALIKGATKGEHGLVLFGSGDWNDGMTKVGSEGKGESVWSTFFIILVMKKFLSVAKAFSDSDFEDFLKKNISDYTSAAEKYCWDGEWYLRGFFDDGTPLGGNFSEECKIDILPQAFAVLSGLPFPEKNETALSSVEKYLVDNDMRTVKLFSPPFDKTEKTPGYIKGYIPGVRENGGQYTHAAVWYAMALFSAGKTELAYKITEYLNPVTHARTEKDVSVYGVEPYVTAGDVYLNGRGGWSFYTGSAAWYFKLITECLLGLEIKGGKLTFHPSLPKEWNGYSATLFYGGAKIDITVEKSDGDSLTVDGEKADFVLLDGKNRTVLFFFRPKSGESRDFM